MKIKNIFGTCVDFVVDKKKYFLAGLVFIGIIFVLGYCVNNSASNNDPEAGIYQDFSEDENEELNSLIQNYYSAYADGNTDLLAFYANPISDSEKSYIKFMSKYVEAFGDIKVYSKRGAEDNTYLVSVYMKEKFKDIDTAAPGLDFFYVRTGKNGNLYIDNVYSSYNQTNVETELDSEIVTLISAYEQRADVINLTEQVQEEYDQAISSDKDLKKFLEEKLPTKIAKWKASYQTKQEQEEAQAELKAKQEKEKKEQEEAEAKKKAEEEKAAKEEEANKKTGTITEKVKVRESASTDANSLGTIDGGTSVTVYSTDDGWCKIDYNGTKAYVKSDYVSIQDDSSSDDSKSDDSDDSKSEDSKTEDTDTTTTETKTVYLTSSVNVRSEASESASKVKLLYAGTTVTILSSDSNGWSKVSADGVEGYAMTQYLK